MATHNSNTPRRMNTGKLEARFLGGLGDFDLHAVGDGLRTMALAARRSIRTLPRHFDVAPERGWPLRHLHR